MEQKKQPELPQKLGQVYAWLLREKVGDELIFQKSHVTRYQEQYPGISVSAVYAAISLLAKKGIITKKRKNRGEGLLLGFNPPDTVVVHQKTKKVVLSGGRTSTRSTFAQIRARVVADIALLEEELSRKQEFLAQMDKYIKEVV